MKHFAPDRPVPAEALFPQWRGREDFAARLDPVETALLAGNEGLSDTIAAVPFERFDAAGRPTVPVFKYHRPTPDEAALLAQVPEALRAPYLCALLIWHMRRFGTAFAASGLPGEFALHYADMFARQLDRIEADPGFAVLDKDSFRKELWLARVVMIPAFAQLWWPHAGLSAKSLVKGGLRALLYVLVRCGGRLPFLEGHTHDPVAKAYWNEKGWGEALRLAALALPALPQVRGATGIAWFYDPAVKRVSPRIAFAQDLQVGRGACRFEIGSNEAALANALATSAERRNQHKAGTYLPKDYCIVWSRKDLARSYGDQGRAGI